MRYTLHIIYTIKIQKFTPYAPFLPLVFCTIGFRFWFLIVQNACFCKIENSRLKNQHLSWLIKILRDCFLRLPQVLEIFSLYLQNQ